MGIAGIGQVEHEPKVASEEVKDIFSHDIRALVEDSETVLETIGREDALDIEKHTKSASLSYRLLDTANRASKLGVRLIRAWDWKGFLETVEENKRAYLDLSQVTLPSDVLWQRVADAGQELAELLQFAYLYPFLIDDKKAIQYTSKDLAGFKKNIGFTTQQWLAGWCDALGEVYKAMDPYEYDNLKGTYAERLKQKIVLNRRLLCIQEMVFEHVLDPSSSFPPVMNSNSRRRGPGQTFRSKVYRVTRNIESTKKQISAMEDELLLRKEEEAKLDYLARMTQETLEISSGK